METDIHIIEADEEILEIIRIFGTKDIGKRLGRDKEIDNRSEKC